MTFIRSTEKNVVNSDGTVIFTHGKLTGGSLLTQKKTILHERPVIHMDMAKVTLVEGSELLQAFIRKHGVEVLNVAGSGVSKDPEIYGKTFQTVEESIT